MSDISRNPFEDSTGRIADPAKKRKPRSIMEKIKFSEKGVVKQAKQAKGIKKGKDGTVELR